MNLHETAPRMLRIYCLGFALVLCQVGYWSLYRGAELAANQRNPRYWTRVRSVQRGRILDARGQVLAESAPDTQATAQRDDDLPEALRRHLYRRRYPGGSLYSHVLGYSDWRRGETGVESAMAGSLTPPDALATPTSLWDVLAPQPRPGNDVVLTIDHHLQEVAGKALGERAGAVVVVDVASGAVLAMVDWPRFDPAQVADNDAWARMSKDEDNKPLFPRAYAGLYPPGSTFKVLTAAAALDAGTASEQTTYQCDGVAKLGHSTVKCDKLSGHGQLTLSQGIALSCNIALAKTALALGPARWQRAVLATGLTSRLDLFRPGKGAGQVAAGSMPIGSDLTPAELAACGYGQGKLAVTPLWLAGLGQLLGNGGVRHEPYLIDRVQGPDGAVLQKARPDVGVRVVSSDAARRVVAMMKLVMAAGGTGAGLADGMDLAGKTGSAQNPHGQAHSWFLLLAPAGAPKVAVAAVVENAGWGRVAAGPVAVKVARAALAR